jgi:hypothetical protein
MHEGWATGRKMVVRSGPEGQAVMLKTPVKILQTINTVEGKVVDGKGKPLSGVKLTPLLHKKHAKRGLKRITAKV